MDFEKEVELYMRKAANDHGNFEDFRTSPCGLNVEKVIREILTLKK
jgi:hypothetical protein